MSHPPHLPLKDLARCSMLALLLALSASACRSNDDATPNPADDPAPIHRPRL